MHENELLQYIRRQQLPDGSFSAWASPQTTPFIATRKQPNVFMTCCVVLSLCDISAAADICKKAAQFIARQTRGKGRSNYWQQQSAARKQEPYPDDTDDSALAMAVLHQAKMLSTKEMAHFAQTLIASEQQVGGPYNTWVVDVREQPQWQSIDVAVNANIYYTLRVLGAEAPHLKHWLIEQSRSPNVHSDFYVGQAPVYYFLARALGADVPETAVERMQELLPTMAPGSVLQAMLQCALLWCDAANTQFATPTFKAPEPEAFYVDPAYNAKQHYGGAGAFTAAIQLQRITLQKRSVKQPLPKVAPITYFAAVNFLTPQLNEDFASAVEHLQQIDSEGHVLQPASLVRKACKKPPKVTTSELDAASMYGWAAYTAYDAIIDGEPEAVRQLALANSCMRRSYTTLLRHGPKTTAWQEYVATVFDTMDAANDWEQRNTRDPEQPPEYKNYDVLAEKSYGHSLAATAVIAQQVKSLDDPAVRGVQTFYKHFLIARQLNDDAHDWQEDLRSRNITPVVALLLQHDTSDYSLLFWQQISPRICRDIEKHCRKARQALGAIEPVADTALFVLWLAHIEKAVKQVRHGRQQALQFIQAIGTPA